MTKQTVTDEEYEIIGLLEGREGSVGKELEDVCDDLVGRGLLRSRVQMFLFRNTNGTPSFSASEAQLVSRKMYQATAKGLRARKGAAK